MRGGIRQTRPRIYQAALQRLTVRPADTLFIDDTPGHVSAAESLGMTGHVHTCTAGTITGIEDFLSAQPTRHWRTWHWRTWHWRTWHWRTWHWRTWHWRTWHWRT